MATDPLSSAPPSCFSSLHLSIVPRYALPYCDYISRLFADCMSLRLFNLTTNHNSNTSNDLSGTGGKLCKFWATSIFIMISCGVIAGRLFLLKDWKRHSDRNRQNNSGTQIAGDGVTSECLESSANADVCKPNGRMITSRLRVLKRDDIVDIDPGLLKKHSSSTSYTTTTATYPSIRTFFCPHPHIDKLPSRPSPLPLLVFVHGLGGSLAQFHSLLTTLVNVAPCFGIDLPGCGLSQFSPKFWDAYSIEALANLVAAAIEQHRDSTRGQKVILIAHSLGCSLSALIASSSSPVIFALRKHIIGLIAICPAASPPSQSDTAKFRKLLLIPNPLFDLWRRWDRRGGPHSHSVSRFVGERSDLETKLLQVRFNEQSKTPVWRRMAWGALPTYNGCGEAIGGIPGANIWSGVQLPILFIAGEADTITTPLEVAKILQFLGIEASHDTSEPNTRSKTIPDAPGVAGTQPARTASFGEFAGDDRFPLQLSKIDQHFPPRESNGPTISNTIPSNMKRVVKTFMFPAPASHALLYDRSTYRALSGLIQDFLFRNIDHRLSLGWQLQHLTDSGKWDVKNVAKWKTIQPVSQPIAGMFVAMKTLREVDEEHTPSKFVQRWKDKIFAVIDISHESPVYDPAQLDKGGIQYHKLPTVSKVPPTTDEVRQFISLVERLEPELSAQTMKTGSDTFRPFLGIHCHYGFNRTGFFITSYLVEKKGFSIQEALDEFEKCRPPGIRHEHFIDTLFVRYCIGLQGSSTLSHF